jgi:tRNA (Thr-GGU) A37 N-methylase
LTLVRLVERSSNVLVVDGLDAIDGTPVLDIKPYYPPYDEPAGERRVPDYVSRLDY